MNTEDGAKLYDVCPHVSDSVHMLCQKGVALSVRSCSGTEDYCRLGKIVRKGEEAWAGHKTLAFYLSVVLPGWLTEGRVYDLFYEKVREKENVRHVFLGTCGSKKRSDALVMESEEIVSRHVGGSSARAAGAPDHSSHLFCF